jgi:hypothetical protein
MQMANQGWQVHRFADPVPFESVLLQELKVCVGMLAGAWVLSGQAGVMADQSQWVRDIVRTRVRDIHDGCNSHSNLSSMNCALLSDLAARVESLANATSHHSDISDRDCQFDLIRRLGAALFRAEHRTSWGCV